jgi:hypothetical protein
VIQICIKNEDMYLVGILKKDFDVQENTEWKTKIIDAQQAS